MSSRRVAPLLIPVVVCALASPIRAAAQAPVQAPKPAASPAAARNTERVVIIDMQGVIMTCNEGLRDFDALGKKLQPRQAELQKLSAQLDGLKKQLDSGGATMGAAARDALVKTIETRTKTVQRAAEDFQNESGQQQNEIAKRILQKLAPVLKKYVDENGYGLVLDASQPWPAGPVVVAAPTVDITKAVVAAYNTVSGVPAPPKSAK
jgi:outer membrane protein